MLGLFPIHGRRMLWAGSLMVAGASLGLSGCASTHTTSAGAVGIDRPQFVSMVSAQDMETSSVKAYAAELNKARTAGKLNVNTQQVERVRNIARRLIPQTAAFRTDAPGWKWEVNVITSDQLNAWCMAGGKIAVYTGLIDKLKLTDDELAAVMGHEISHALREHARERVSQKMATGLGVDLISIGLGLGAVGKDLVGMVSDVTISLPYSREHETEADRMGVELAARAGYDPRAAITLWEKMGSAGGGAPPELLSTHPAPANRMRDLEDYSRRVEPLYEAAKRRG
ncbi:MAG TPA: M48 family metallopeptidase [Limnobacter sp.]|uniref:M48 family metallopeptidase n=1 Tax=Limnobacter sp. TaxID=2003368 RepID=UPI002EDAEDBD